MTRGIILSPDINDGHCASLWMAGEPRTFWASLDVSGKDVRPIVSWRCENCGFLENFVEL